MNGKKAKQLRTIVRQSIPQAPVKAYETLSHGTKVIAHPFKIDAQGAPEEVVVDVSQTVLSSSCQRAVYQELKKRG